MAIDQAAVGTVAAELMEELAESYGEDATIDTVAVVVSVTHAGGAATNVHSKVSESTPVHVAIGLLEYVSRALGPRPMD
jgi:hypothetical protein